jgi:hypothetical protein
MKHRRTGRVDSVTNIHNTIALIGVSFGDGRMMLHDNYKFDLEAVTQERLAIGDRLVIGWERAEPLPEPPEAGPPPGATGYDVQVLLDKINQQRARIVLLTGLNGALLAALIVAVVVALAK